MPAPSNGRANLPCGHQRQHLAHFCLLKHQNLCISAQKKASASGRQTTSPVLKKSKYATRRRWQCTEPVDHQRCCTQEVIGSVDQRYALHTAHSIITHTWLAQCTTIIRAKQRHLRTVDGCWMLATVNRVRLYDAMYPRLQPAMSPSQYRLLLRRQIWDEIRTVHQRGDVSWRWQQRQRVTYVVKRSGAISGNNGVQTSPS